MRNLLMLLAALLTTGLLLGAATGCDSSEPRPENAVLENRTDGPMLYNLPGVLPDPIRPFEIELTDPPHDLIAAGDTAVLGPCTLPGPYEDRLLSLWDVVPAEDGSTATAAQTAGWSSGELLSPYGVVKLLRDNNCRIVVDSLSPSLASSSVLQ